MKLLVFGENGQVAREIANAASIKEIDANFLSRAKADFNDPACVAGIIAASDADVIVNAVAYTAVDKAERDVETAFRVNAETPGMIVAACAKRDLPLVHISTDFVFDGEARHPYTEKCSPNPLSVYGASKLAGEKAVLGSSARVMILRTSWVFSAHGNNFVRTMLRLGAIRPELNVVADQIGGPTSARAIAGAILITAAQMKDGAKGGLYHFQSAPQTSWAGFARAIFDAAGMETIVNDIPASDYPTPAKRPAYSVLDCAKIYADFGISVPDWREDLADVVQALSTESDMPDS